MTSAAAEPTPTKLPDDAPIRILVAYPRRVDFVCSRPTLCAGATLCAKPRGASS